YIGMSNGSFATPWISVTFFLPPAEPPVEPPPHAATLAIASTAATVVARYRLDCTSAFLSYLFGLPVDRWCSPPRLFAFADPAAQLVEEDGDDEHRADRDEQPGLLHVDDDQAVEDDDRDEYPDHRAG